MELLLMSKSDISSEAATVGMEPLVSVVVPVYNVRDYLEECVCSLVKQTYSNIEVLLIDDGSTDGSGDLCDSLANKDDRISTFHKTNGGLSDARNYGIDCLTGDFVAFVDSDDFVHPNYVERLLEPFFSDDELDISVCSYSLFEDGQLFELPDTTNGGYETITSKEALSRLCEPHRSMQLEIACSKLFKKSLLHGIRFPVGKVHEDTATTYKLYYAARHIAVSEAKLYYYRQRAGSITGKFRPSNMDMIGNLIERDQFYRSNLPRDISEKHTAFALNAIIRLYYSAEGSGYENSILKAYRSFYKRASKLTSFQQRLRAYLQYRVPGLCRVLFTLKDRFC